MNSSTAHLLADAARVVAQVVDRGRALDEVLAQYPAEKTVSKAALQALGFGTLRWYPRLAGWIEMLVTRIEGMDPQVRALLAVALHQLNFSRHPTHAIGNSAVDAAKVLGHARAGGLVNAVLRRF